MYVLKMNALVKKEVNAQFHMYWEEFIAGDIKKKALIKLKMNREHSIKRRE